MRHWLYAVVMRLVALRPGAVPAYHGHFTRAALLNLMRRGDAPLAAALHDANIGKPYTISLLGGGQRGPDGALHFGEGSEALWRFTLLYEPAFDAVVRRFLLDRSIPHVRIGAVHFAITDAFVAFDSHPASGSMALANLQSSWDCPPESLPETLTLRFVSPTTFNLGQRADGYRWHPVPDPRLVFSTLRKRWARLGGAEPGDPFDQWVEDHVLIDALDIQTRRVPIKHRTAPAFTGTARYRVSGDRRWWALVHLLADLSFWTGLGYQTPYGLGQVRCMTSPEDARDG